MNDDSDDRDGTKDRSSSVGVVNADNVIVSAREREMKRPPSLGCVFHASVIERWVFEIKWHDAAMMQQFAHKHKGRKGR